MRKIVLVIASLIFLSLLAIPSYAEIVADEGCCPSKKLCFLFENKEPYCYDYPLYSPARIYAAAVIGEGLGCENRRYATAGLFYAPCVCESRFQPFLDVRGHYLKNDRWAANAGLGLRYLDACSRIYGANLFYDYRDFCVGSFHQVGFGLEYLGACWDLRANGYFPINRRNSKSQLFNNYIGNFFARCKRSERALTGADVEIGTHLYRCGCFAFYAGVGGYYYHHKHRDNSWGGMARVKALFTQYASIEVKVTHDREFHTNAQGIFMLSLPLEMIFRVGNCAACFCESLLFQPVERNETITIDKRCCWISNF